MTLHPGPGAALLLTAALTLAGCASTPAAPAASTAPASEEGGTPHGYVEGAAELGEPQHLLAAIDAGGAVRLLDPVTEEVVELGELGEVQHLEHDGRFLAATTDAGVAIVDTGAWTVDHGDHAHYYRAEPRIVGSLELSGEATIQSTESMTAVAAGGEVVLLDRDALGQGRIVERSRVDGAAATGFAAPIGDGAVVAMPGGVVALDADGGTTAQAPCTDPAGGVTTRVGVALGCAEGVVLATETASGVELERIDYPAGTDAATRAVAFGMRAGRATAAAVAGKAGLWLLDTRERTWTMVPTEAPLMRAVAVDDEEGHIVGIDATGRVVVLDESGAELGATEPVVPVGDGAPALEVDASRAYVAVAADDAVLEIDYADEARIARTLAVEAPLHLAETGR